MSTKDDIFQFPFISGLFSGRASACPSNLYRRSLSMKDKAICLDDDPLSLRLVEHLLKKRFEVFSCLNVEKAINVVKDHSIDLFLCDYHLGEDFNGAEAFEHLRGRFGFNPLHSILITSYPSPEIEARTKAIGFHRVFAKPLRKEFQAHCLNLRIPRYGRNPITAS